jgi:hypothetical protein
MHVQIWRVAHDADNARSDAPVLCRPAVTAWEGAPGYAQRHYGHRALSGAHVACFLPAGRLAAGHVVHEAFRVVPVRPGDVSRICTHTELRPFAVVIHGRVGVVRDARAGAPTWFEPARLVRPSEIIQRRALRSAVAFYSRLKPTFRVT